MITYKKYNKFNFKLYPFYIEFFSKSTLKRRNNAFNDFVQKFMRIFVKSESIKLQLTLPNAFKTNEEQTDCNLGGRLR